MQSDPFIAVALRPETSACHCEVKWKDEFMVFPLIPRFRYFLFCSIRICLWYTYGIQILHQIAALSLFPSSTYMSGPFCWREILCYFSTKFCPIIFLIIFTACQDHSEFQLCPPVCLKFLCKYAPSVFNHRDRCKNTEHSQTQGKKNNKKKLNIEYEIDCEPLIIRLQMHFPKIGLLVSWKFHKNHILLSVWHLKFWKHLTAYVTLMLFPNSQSVTLSSISENVMMWIMIDKDILANSHLFQHLDTHLWYLSLQFFQRFSACLTVHEILPRLSQTDMFIVAFSFS